ncbi:hypothetical protein GCM10009808_15540 [Microbacterium sediminicola]|uniref:Uncharacterized protein n=1 Tax=Microbacterium sediminicola TaxID=415210 RepID=A0ABN2I5D1_9MICO
MALSRKRRPLGLITGKVLAQEPRQEYADGKPTGNVGRFDVTLLQKNFATPDVRFPVGPNFPEVPAVDAEVALIVEFGETDEWGANIRIVRYATEDDLESIAKVLPALATASR